VPIFDTIKAIKARQVLDSRGNPTVEVDVHCEGGAMGRAIVPSGASTGKHEALELRDGDLLDYGGKGVRRAVANVQTVLAPLLVGMSASAQEKIDRTMLARDGTPDKSCLGANALLGVSLACAHAAAAARGEPLWQYLERKETARLRKASLPLPMVNLISGGLHAGGNVEMQDFLLLPIGASSYSEALSMTGRAYRALAATLAERGYESVLVGDEGGFGPKLRSNEQALALIMAAFKLADFRPGTDVAIAIDAASSHFYKDGRYHLEGGALDAEAMVHLFCRWVDSYPVVSIEDGMAEDDWSGWEKLTAALDKRVQLIGDDLFVTNPARLEAGIGMGIANSILIKVNQIGTLTETLAVIQQAQTAGYRAVVSARSGETEDATIADLAVASGAGQIKIGSIARGERLAKYNQLLRIEEQMGPAPPFARWDF
jgi:enolase